MQIKVNVIPDFRKREMAQRISILYYEKDWSQNEISKELEISRSYVSQLLSFARNSGIVKFTVNVDEYNLRMIRREIELKEKFPEVRQFYIMASESEEFTERNLGSFAAPYFSELITDAKVIGVNLGRSVEKTIHNLKSHSLANSENKKVVQIMGGFNKDIAQAHPNELVKKLSSILNCEFYYLNCPAVIEQDKLREVLVKEKTIQNVIKMWHHMDLAIMGLGVTDDRSKLFSLFNESMKKDIKESGACSDLNINFFDEQGCYIPLLENHKISIPFEELKNVRKKVVICSGEYKKRAIIGAIRAKMIDVLITDTITMDAVEKYSESKESL